MKKQVLVKTATEAYQAVAKGVNDRGELLVLKSGVVSSVNAADVSVVIE